jgi:outer membrane biosynthesis protein TonB
LYKSNKYNEFLLKKEEEKKIKKQKKKEEKKIKKQKQNEEKKQKKEEEKKIKKQKQEEEKKIKKQKEEEEKKQKKQKQNNQKNFGLKNSSINCYFNSAIQILNLDENFKSLVNSGKNKK